MFYLFVFILISFSVTLMTGLGEVPVYISLHKNSNNQFDFLEFLLDSVLDGFLQRGDILICDNSAVHKGREIQDQLQELISLVGFELFFLPTYSPEV